MLHLESENVRLSSELSVASANARNSKARLEDEKQKAYAAGKEDFLQSTKYAELIRRTRLDGARNFMKSPAFKYGILRQATEDGFINFYKCLDQLK
ncbi:UNVERIFIED_CONTAM: hypothetical protein Slati_0444800 [Sesamum latifolium]|uniref:Uncharacterized protein n=1 Tax=Sesamum latifolium TaxID=2727402 RepID=A0AAW2XZE6_9LAMI